MSFSVIAIAGLSLLVTRDPSSVPPPTETASAARTSRTEPVETTIPATFIREADIEAAPTAAMQPIESTAAIEVAANAGEAAPAALAVTESVATAPVTGTAAVPVDQESVQEAEAPATVTQADIEALLAAWTRGWQQQDMSAYFAAYASDFVPANGATRERWQADRTRIIGNARDIRISWNELDWRVLDADNVTVELALDYQAAGYRDVTRKQLRLQRESDGLRIAEEQNLAVERR